jgi:hypothetical protein
VRQSAGPLEPEVRLRLWHRVFRRFFPWVWSSIVLLFASGYGMMLLYFGGFAGAGLYIDVMQGIGIVMMLLFLHLFFLPWRRFSDAVERKHFPEAVKHLDQNSSHRRGQPRAWPPNDEIRRERKRNLSFTAQELIEFVQGNWADRERERLIRTWGAPTTGGYGAKCHDA